ncbi:MAG: DNRLRE domain-containing protein [Myxococcota bacterium]|nr:DNRLRE domain-containing protein [Myxococcota bacterium]
MHRKIARDAWLLFCGCLIFSGCFRLDKLEDTSNTCTLNKACGAPAICWNGACQALPCSNDESCSGSLTCQSNFCAPIYCSSDDGCPNDWHCESVGECVCVPSCNGKVCGDDGCGGSCGTCSAGSECSGGGECLAVCEPDCTDKECGPDGCEGECGRCTSNGYCTAYGTCACDPQCEEDWECGDNGCGGDCGTCPQAAPICNTSEHQCVTECTPDCDGKECGDDGCGGECGTCPGAAPICNTSTQLCELECSPACEGKSCGPDGCGGSCGECTETNTECDDDTGQCVCLPQCAEGQECGDDGCDGTCGEGCDAGESCNDDNQCVCEPQCAEGQECGDDGCDGDCGTCATDFTCIANECVANSAMESNCSDGEDNDGDGAIDCADGDCYDISTNANGMVTNLTSCTLTRRPFVFVQADNGAQHFIQPTPTQAPWARIYSSSLDTSYANTHWPLVDYIQLDSPVSDVQALLRYDIDAWMDGIGQVQKAYLGFYAFYVGGANGDPPSDVELFANQGAFDENTVTWNTAPTHGALHTSVYAQELGWYAFDITGLYNAWQADPASNHGVRLAAAPHTAGDGGWDGVATMLYSSQSTIKDLNGLSQVVVYETTTGQPPSYTFDVGSAAFGPGVDFSTNAAESYDLFWSDAQGNHSPSGPYLTITATYSSSYSYGGYNIGGVKLVFDDGVELFANVLVDYICNANMENAGYECEDYLGRAVDGDTSTYTTLGGTNDSTPALSMTFGFWCPSERRSVFTCRP